MAETHSIETAAPAKPQGPLDDDGQALDQWDYVPVSADMQRHVRKLRAIETALRSATGPEGLRRALREAETAHRALHALSHGRTASVRIPPLRLSIPLRPGEQGLHRGAGRWFRLDSRAALPPEMNRSGLPAHNVSMRMHGETSRYPLPIDLANPELGLVYLTTSRLIHRGRAGHLIAIPHRHVIERSFYADAFEIRYFDEPRTRVVSDVVFVSETDAVFIGALIEALGQITL